MEKLFVLDLCGDEVMEMDIQEINDFINNMFENDNFDDEEIEIEICDSNDLNHLDSRLSGIGYTLFTTKEELQEYLEAE
jgi:hypothetical protein